MKSMICEFQKLLWHNCQLANFLETESSTAAHILVYRITYRSEA